MPQLRSLSGPRKEQAVVLRPPGPYLFGRALGAHFQIPDRLVSRRHFSITFRNEGYVLTDLDSSAGTFVNGTAVDRRVVVRDGDRIRAGSSSFVFEYLPKDPLVGRELGGYRILERVGGGGMGTVYRALQVSLCRIVALKVLHASLAADDDFSVLFIQEARAAAELSHEQILRVYDVNRLDGILFYAMEFAAKGSVSDLIRRSVRLSVRQALELAHRASLGLEYAEKVGIVHRDIKPANLMIDQNGELKIGDLGVAARVSAAAGATSGPSRGPSRSAPSSISGSPTYMPPEQALGRPVDHRGDLYSLGASLYEMLTGIPPFRGDTVKDVLCAHLTEPPPDPRAQRDDVPSEAAELVQRLMARSVERRPASATETRQCLERLLASGRVNASRRARMLSLVPAGVSLYVVTFAVAVLVGFLVTLVLLR